MGPQNLIRCFIAVEVSEPSIVEKVSAVQSRLESTGADIKLVEHDNLHLTLWFLGEIAEPRLRQVMEAMRKVRFNKFSINLRGIGYFPGGGRINVIWIGVEDPSGSLKSIHSQLVRLLEPIGFKPEDREFTPHLTICRVKSVRDKSRLVSTIKDVESMEFGSQPVEKLYLKRSVLTPKGPIYSNLFVVEGE
ncbi:MAG: 2'-5' RNA ligase [Candidatus Terraquivivens tikiterensis]|uniref:RNA 2',3'-cyclic phosphodiesterase n=1 Tax=Candidatus Terraquivivens tikiterensis TaxID=1980982 RepID=A0A2R7Y1U8_9ARCH|nr:MAG: 2'-5' RNA ligase [Candidatus Terraquivivens tikiterensis]